MGTVEKEKLYQFFAELLDDIEYPAHKKEHTKIMFKRIMGRAMPSTWEYHTLMGVFSRSLGTIKRTHEKKR
jgi:tRNA C32,U32 (ribose-2'-O)-methylase TrmJ